MPITRTMRFISCLVIALLAPGCSQTGSNDTSIQDTIKGWNCLFQAHDFTNPLNQMPSEPTLAYANFCEHHKAVLEDAQSYINKEMAKHNPPSPPDVFLDIFGKVEGAAVYESEAGEHAITYDVYIKGKYTEWDCLYLLLYDKNDKRVKVIVTKHNPPSRGFGRIQPKFWMV